MPGSHAVPPSRQATLLLGSAESPSPVLPALVAMASGKVDPLLALLVALNLAGIPGIAPPDQLGTGLSNPRRSALEKRGS